jgi:hypothetical protein
VSEGIPSREPFWRSVLIPIVLIWGILAAVGLVNWFIMEVLLGDFWRPIVMQLLTATGTELALAVSLCIVVAIVGGAILGALGALLLPKILGVPDGVRVPVKRFAIYGSLVAVASWVLRSGAIIVFARMALNDLKR